MTDPVVTLDTQRVHVEPGGQAQVSVTIFNPGTIVEGYQLEVLGEGPSQWAEVLPPEVSVYPKQEATAIVVFSTPSGAAAPGGEHAFGVRARSTLDETSSTVAEGDIEIGKVFGLQAKIIPVTSTGRWRGRHVVQFSNWGNSSARLRLVASDPDAALGFYLRPDVIDLPLGGSATVRLLARTRKPFLRGTPVRLPFQIVGERAEGATAPPTPGLGYGDPSRPVVDGALNQRPILSRFVVTAVALLLVASIAVGVWAFTRKTPAAATDLTDLGVPATPNNVAAKPIDSTTIDVAWDLVELADAYEILPVQKGQDPQEGTIGAATRIDDAQQRQASVRQLLPGSEHCFRVVAKRGKVSSQPSAEVCERTPAATGTPGPNQPSSSEPTQTAESPTSNGPPSSLSPTGPATGSTSVLPPPTTVSPTGQGGTASQTSGSGPQASGSLGAGKWVVVAWSAFPARSSADQKAAALQQKGFTDAQVISADQFPRMTVGMNTTPPGFYHTVVGPFDTRDAALAICDRVLPVTGQCLTGQPEPPE